MRNTVVKRLRKEVFMKMNYSEGTRLSKVMKTPKFKKIFRARKKNYTNGVAK